MQARRGEPSIPHARSGLLRLRWPNSPSRILAIGPADVTTISPNAAMKPTSGSGTILPAQSRHAEKVSKIRWSVFAAGLLKIASGKATLVVHSGTIRAALCIALDITPSAALRFVIDPLSITCIDRLKNGWRVVSVNQNVAPS